MKVLILSCGTRCLLVDYFMDRNNGFDFVVTTDCSIHSPALYRSDKHYIVPPMHDSSYLSIIFEICHKDKIDAILPLQEDELILLAKHNSEFSQRGIFPIISNSDVVNLCRDKLLFYQYLNTQGISAVPTYRTSEMELIKTINSFPFFMKPRYGAGSVSNYKIYNETIISAIVENDSQEYVLQPFIRGDEYGINTYVDFCTDAISEIFIMKKIRMRAGETEKSISVHNAEIEEMVSSLCFALQLRGPVDIDVLEKDGKYFILEVNPRFGGGYPHAYNCGVNFIRLLANNIKGIPNTPSSMYYEDKIVAFRYMDITVMHEEDIG